MKFKMSLQEIIETAKASNQPDLFDFVESDKEIFISTLKLAIDIDMTQLEVRALNALLKDIETNLHNDFDLESTLTHYYTLLA